MIEAKDNCLKDVLHSEVPKNFHSQFNLVLNLDIAMGT